MQARLAHQEKIAALGRVAAQVAHEVRNPLTGLQLRTGTTVLAQEGGQRAQQATKVAATDLARDPQ